MRHRAWLRILLILLLVHNQREIFFFWLPCSTCYKDKIYTLHYPAQNNNNHNKDVFSSRFLEILPLSSLWIICKVGLDAALLGGFLLPGIHGNGKLLARGGSRLSFSNERLMIRKRPEVQMSRRGEVMGVEWLKNGELRGRCRTSSPLDHHAECQIPEEAGRSSL